MMENNSHCSNIRIIGLSESAEVRNLIDFFFFFLQKIMLEDLKLGLELSAIVMERTQKLIDRRK